jgi:outer membrane protein assembly factor BamB
MVAAFDALTGERVWLTRGILVGLAYVTVEGLALSADGNRLYVSGWGAPSQGSMEYQLLALDAQTGDVLWTRQEARNHLSASLAVSPDGSQVVLALTQTVMGAGRILTLALDAHTGEEQWRAVNTLEWQSWAFDVAHDGARVYVTGAQDFGSGPFYLVVYGYDAASGALVWAHRSVDPREGTFGTGITLAGTRVVVTGETYGEPEMDVVTLALEGASGELLWSSKYDQTGSYDNKPHVTASPDGSRVYVGATSQGGQSRDFVVLAYDAQTGSRDWVATYDSTGYDILHNIAATNERVFAVGSVADESYDTYATYHYQTLALNAQSGAREWGVRHAGADLHSNPIGLAVGNNGLLYVAGQDNLPRAALLLAYAQEGPTILAATSR